MTYIDEYKKWLESDALTPDEMAELKSIAGDDKEIESRFCNQLEFGTAGLRGVMGAGINRMNVHVVRHATQAFAEVILEDGPDTAKKGIVICYDCRHHSREYAEEAACVMAANGIPVKLFTELRPTPELSFAIRQYGCTAGINITSSHNPKEYNGYKVYWADGAQLPPQHASAIAEKMATLDIFDCVKTVKYDSAVSSGMITMLADETDELFLEQVMGQVIDREAISAVADTFKMIYTPFHGTGYKLIPEALRRLGMKHVICVPEQMVIDGEFPTVASPNPENPEGFALAIQLAKENGADFILGSDPDADRVGIMVKNDEGEYVTISGNQTGVLLIDYLIGAKTRAGTMPANPVILKTIVTTEMARKVAAVNGVKCYDTFTGFKFMAEKKNLLESTTDEKVIFSYEESYGYMAGDYVRDKDAVTASVLLTEMAAWYSAKGMTLYDALIALFEKYGFYGERTINLVMPGLDGRDKINSIMSSLRSEPPKSISGTKVLAYKDYADGTITDLSTSEKTKIELAGANVLNFVLEDETTILVRPSGTEPKIKIYILAKGIDRKECDEKISDYSSWAESFNK
jgi:phosphoglucomutase